MTGQHRTYIDWWPFVCNIFFCAHETKLIAPNEIKNRSYNIREHKMFVRIRTTFTRYMMQNSTIPLYRLQ